MHIPNCENAKNPYLQQRPRLASGLYSNRQALHSYLVMSPGFTILQRREPLGHPRDWSCLTVLSSMTDTRYVGAVPRLTLPLPGQNITRIHPFSCVSAVRTGSTMYLSRNQANGGWYVCTVSGHVTGGRIVRYMCRGFASDLCSLGDPHKNQVMRAFTYLGPSTSTGRRARFDNLSSLYLHCFARELPISQPLSIK